MNDDHVKQFESFLTTTHQARLESERDRDYFDGKQWTSEEAKILQGRGQAPVVINRIKRKVLTMVGLEIKSRTDPKALPRTPQHEKDAEAVTDALRFVADNTGFDQIKSRVFNELVVEGYSAALIDTVTKGGKEWVDVTWVPFDRFYFDSASRLEDFDDAGYRGLTSWQPIETAKAMFPEADFDALKQQAQDGGNVDSTFEDRPRWFDNAIPGKPRIRINQHYFKQMAEGFNMPVWHVVYFTHGATLKEPEVIKILDEYGEPICPLIGVSLYVDRENNRYGEVRDWIHPQDEVNHRRSKAMHAMSNVTIIREPGAVKSGARVLDQLAMGKADIELQNPNARFEIDRNTEMTQSQLAMMQEAKQEIDLAGANSALQGKDGSASSGRELEISASNGTNEIGWAFTVIQDWQRRAFEAIWLTVKQTWTDERWIRVTDDEDNLKWVSLNRKVTGRDALAEQMGLEPEGVEQALQSNGIPVPFDLDQPTGDVQNAVAQMELDVVVGEAPDVAALQQEVFAQIAQLAPSFPNDITFDDIIDLAPLRTSVKDKFRERREGQGAEAQQLQAAQQKAMQREAAMVENERMADIATKAARARKDNAQADQTNLESQLAALGREAIG